MPGMAPVHPGVVLEEILADHGLDAGDAAVRLGVARQTMKHLLAGQQKMSAEVGSGSGGCAGRRSG